MRFTDSGSPDAGPPLVWCEDCGFRWFGPTSAHGLSVLGRCSRCGGEVHFAANELPDSDAPAPDAHEAALQPWQVLGAPHHGQ